MTTAGFIFALMLACITLAALIAVLRPSGDGQDPGADDEQGSGGDGGSDRLPFRPLSPSGAGEPAWWPQFERDLAEYTAHSGRDCARTG